MVVCHRASSYWRTWRNRWPPGPDGKGLHLVAHRRGPVGLLKVGHVLGGPVSLRSAVDTPRQVASLATGTPSFRSAPRRDRAAGRPPARKITEDDQTLAGPGPGRPLRRRRRFPGSRSPVPDVELQALATTDPTWPGHPPPSTGGPALPAHRHRAPRDPSPPDSVVTVISLSAAPWNIHDSRARREPR